MLTRTDIEKQILHERAMILAQKTALSEKSTGIPVFSFFLAKERYAIEAKYIQHVFPLQDLTPLPGLPSYHLGITSLERKFISVIKIEYFLKIPDRILSSLNRVILIQIDSVRFCILTDRIEGLDWMDTMKIKQIKTKESHTEKSLIQGMDDSGKILLKIQNLLENVDFFGGNKCF